MQKHSALRRSSFQQHAAPESAPREVAGHNPTAQAADWRSKLMPQGTTGLYVGDERNVIIAMRESPELNGLARFNEFALQIEFTRAPPWRSAAEGQKWAEEDDVACAAWLQAQGIKVRGKGVVADCIAVVARDSVYHPVCRYLNALKWDGQARLQRWVRDYLGAAGDESYLGAVGSRFMISAVARVMAPGCQADHVLVLEGPQNIGKTSTARLLAIQPDWFAGDLPDIHSKDARLQLSGHWIVEIAELKAFKGSEIEAVKSFMTQTHDTFRPPYGRRAGQFPRQSVFIATTNESEYLHDETGNRRYWPVRCSHIDLERLKRDRDQLWAEAVAEYRAGTPWYLTADEERLATAEQAERELLTEIDEDVRAFLRGERCAGRNEITMRDVLIWGLGLAPDKPDYSERARRLGPAVAKALKRFGWRRIRREGSGREKRTVYRRQDSGG